MKLKLSSNLSVCQSAIIFCTKYFYSNSGCGEGGNKLVSYLGYGQRIPLSLLFPTNFLDEVIVQLTVQRVKKKRRKKSNFLILFTHQEKWKVFLLVKTIFNRRENFLYFFYAFLLCQVKRKCQDRIKEFLTEVSFLKIINLTAYFVKFKFNIS